MIDFNFNNFTVSSGLDMSGTNITGGSSSQSWLSSVPDAGEAFKGLGGLMGAKATYDAGQEAERRADQNADNMLMSLMVDLRALKKEQERVQSATVARSAASGVMFEGTPSEYLRVMQKEHRLQRTMMLIQGMQEIEAMKQQGDDAAEQGKWDAIGGLVSGGASMLTGMGAF